MSNLVNNDKNIPVFLHSPTVYQIFYKVAESIPSNSKAFLVGGMMRNAVYYKFFSEKLPERDFDLVFIGNIQKFVQNLRETGFTYGKIRRKHETVLKKKKFENPVELGDYVFLDIHISEETDMEKNILENTGYTINGFALSLSDIFSPDWFDKMISHPKALGDIQSKQLRLNNLKQIEKKGHPSMLFSCIRFMSLGFRPPSKKEINILLARLRKLEKYKFDRNIKKVYDYVGGEKKAKLYAKQLGVKEDIFNIKTLRDN